MQATCAAIDWGTTRFRIWTLDRRGAVVAERQSDRGMSTLKPADYEAVLENVMSEIGAAADLPAIICGMAGSAQGWKEAPYADLPALPGTIAGAAVRVPSDSRDIRILPGLAQRDPSCPDVMRGEETLILGVTLSGMNQGTICLPGTHSKWVRIVQGAVTEFHTTMTGELYALLSRQSTLSHMIKDADAVDCEHPCFIEGVRQAVARPHSVASALFSARAAPLLHLATGEDMAARLSGLLIGLELAGMLPQLNDKKTDEITLVSQGPLARLYDRALGLAGMNVRTLDSDDMVRAGLFSAAKTLWPL